MEPLFIMGATIATGCVQVSKDPRDLDDGNFWAVSVAFDGSPIFARFEKLEKIESGATQRSIKSEEPWVESKGAWKSSLSREGYENYVKEIRSAIEAGTVYQVNACRVLTNTFTSSSLLSLYLEILAKNPAPYASYFRTRECEIASASPELFLTRSGNRIRTSPIKGTLSGEENFGSKDTSENIMIVDLMRNDLGQICIPGSVKVSELLRDERHPGLRHLVSDIEGELTPGITWAEIFASLLPAGSISGAPKSSALKIINDQEKFSRGPYCGILGWVQGNQASLSVAIRIFWSDKKSEIKFGTGAGITWGSEPPLEWEETQLKARRLISIAGGEIE